MNFFSFFDIYIVGQDDQPNDKDGQDDQLCDLVGQEYRYLLNRTEFEAALNIFTNKFAMK